jgi:hypothetical protein
MHAHDNSRRVWRTSVLRNGFERAILMSERLKTLIENFTHTLPCRLLLGWSLRTSVEKKWRHASNCLICGVVFYLLSFSSPHLSSPLLFVLFFSPLIYPISPFLQTSGQVTLCNEKVITEGAVIKRLLLNTLFLELSSLRSCLFFLLNSLSCVTATVSDWSVRGWRRGWKQGLL